jgi:hypothetical protein
LRRFVQVATYLGCNSRETLSEHFPEIILMLLVYGNDQDLVAVSNSMSGGVKHT